MKPETFRQGEEMAQGVSVVICCHNSSKILPTTLKYLAMQEVPADIPWEIIVVDNASTDDTANVARKCWPGNTIAPLTITNEEKLGLAYARQKGFTESKYEFISFIDDDNWCDSHWVKTTFEVMTEHPEAGACGGLSKPIFENTPPEWFKRYCHAYAAGPQGSGPGYVRLTCPLNLYHSF